MVVVSSNGTADYFEMRRNLWWARVCEVPTAASEREMRERYGGDGRRWQQGWNVGAEEGGSGILASAHGPRIRAERAAAGGNWADSSSHCRTATQRVDSSSCYIRRLGEEQQLLDGEA